MTVLETSLYGDLYESLSKYMNRVDLVYMLSELRANFLRGYTHTSPEALHNVCRSCRKCEGVSHPATDPMWKYVDPDLMIVLENPTVYEQHKEILIASLKKAGFSSKTCMLTYLTRCPVQSTEIKDEYIANCVPYLHAEMQSSNPKLIVPMGAKCWSGVSGDITHKISEMEKKLVWFGLYPCIPAMSLSWYSRGDLKRLDEIFISAYHFLYKSKQDSTEV
jgi:uracil-DNA glycosylase